MWGGYQNTVSLSHISRTGVQQPRYRYNAGENVHRSYEAYLWLQDRDGACDTVHFPEWGGPGYFTALAKRQGLAFARTRIVIQTHSPTSWATFGNEAWPDGERFIETDFMERESIRLADILVTPSQYMVRWMAESGYVETPKMGGGGKAFLPFGYARWCWPGGQAWLGCLAG